MFTVKAKTGETTVEIELKSKKLAVDIRDQLRKQDCEAKVISVREID